MKDDKTKPMTDRQKRKLATFGVTLPVETTVDQANRITNKLVVASEKNDGEIWLDEPCSTGYWWVASLNEPTPKLVRIIQYNREEPLFEYQGSDRGGDYTRPTNDGRRWQPAKAPKSPFCGAGSD